MEQQTNTASLKIKRTVAALAAIGVLGAGGAMVVHQCNTCVGLYLLVCSVHPAFLRMA